MLIKKTTLPTKNNRTPYPLHNQHIHLQHFVERITTPDNPFAPHKHEQAELWYIVEGEALVQLDEQEQTAEPGDLIIIEPWCVHGLRTTGHVKWICLG